MGNRTKKYYKLLQPAAGLPAGAIITGPAAEVLANNGKAVEYNPKTQKGNG